MRLILASASSSRARVLRAAAVPFDVIPAEIDEDGLKTDLLARNQKPGEVALALAKAKATYVSTSHRDAIVLGADQVLQFGDELISKCRDMTAARQLLLRLRGQTHGLISALALARSGEAFWTHSETATLKMRMFSEGFLDTYLAAEGSELLSGVGCYRLEARGAQLFDGIEGDYFCIMGLPLVPLLAELRRMDVIAQ